jgi:two-component system response regulator
MKKINKHQIIIVDDEPDYTHLIQEALKRCSPCPTIKVLHSGVDLLEWLETSHRPSLIFLDINMPASSGFDVLRILKSVDKYRVIPVVMLTISGEKNDVVSSYQHGASAFLTKPLSFPELVRRMQLFSHYWFDIAHTPDRSWSNGDNFNNN